MSRMEREGSGHASPDPNLPPNLSPNPNPNPNPNPGPSTPARGADAAKLGLPCDVMVRVHCVLATQGISEEQTFANLFQTNTAEQERLNARCVEQLSAYHEQRTALLSPRKPPDASAPRSPGATGTTDEAPRDPQAARVGALLVHARNLIRSPPDAKNVQLLHAVASLTRLLGGGRITVDDDGRDRAAMSLTLEHGRLLQAHGLSPLEAEAAVRLMRRHGVRRDNARRNGEARLFDFNGVQLRMLPEGYAPPEGSARYDVAHGK